MLKNYSRIIFGFLFLYCFSTTKTQTLITYSCSWTNLNFPPGGASALYYDKQNDDVYFAGTGTIYKINSKTNPWTQIGTDPNNAIWPNAKIISMLIDNTGVFYAGCDGNTHSWISFDRGTNWKEITDPLFMKRDSINNLAINTIYAHTDGTVYFGTDNGIIKTTDHGITFSKVNTPYSYITAIFIDQSNNLFIGTNGGLFRSKDQLKNWTQMGLRLAGDNIHSVLQSRGSIFVSSQSDISISTNSGDTWINQRQNLGFSQYNQLFPLLAALDKNDNVFVCIDEYGTSNLLQGICFTDDNGAHWNEIATMTPPFSNANIPVQPLAICIDSKDFIYIVEAGRLAPYIKSAYRGQRGTTGVEIENKLTAPQDYSLDQNYPNPFNPTTIVKYQLPVNGFVSLKVYDLLGREVAALVNEYKQI